jgi:hypothetical protein
MDSWPTSAAIVFEHIADGAPILYAKRDTALESEDSGWQFLCNKALEDQSKAQIWLINEVIAKEPSLHDYLLLPPGSELVRSSVAEPWTVIN